ncbi:MAG: outer membrane protein [Methyloligellaceae bacterium]
MKKILSKLAAVAILASAFTSSALAGGDLYKPVIWGGFYAGGHLGYAFVDHGADFGEDFDTGQIDIPIFNTIQFIYDADNDADGPLGGVHVGYNVQRRHLVFGIEGDFSKTTSDVGAEARAIYIDNELRFRPTRLEEVGRFDGSAKFKVEMDYLASLRGRVGYANDNYLLYLTGGVAWTQLDASLMLNANGSGNLAGLTGSTKIDLGKENLTGYVIGGGGEYMLGQGMSLRGEVLHYNFDDKGFEFDSTVVRTGLSLHLN